MNNLQKRRRGSSEGSVRKLATSHRPKAKLSTWIGRLLDRTSYERLAIIIGGFILVSSLYYWMATPSGNGLSASPASFSDSLYFSIITLSSLGYGDLVPVGYGRIVASVEVLAGVMLISVFVGKIASERQSRLLVLLQTSEHQRRISHFAREINTFVDLMDMAMTEHNQVSLFKLAKRSTRLLAALKKYLTFQANHGGLAAFGNISSLRTLYKTIATIEEIAFSANTMAETQDRTRVELERLVEWTIAIATIMSPFHQNEPKSRATLDKILRLGNDYRTWEESRKAGNAVFRYRTEVTEPLLKRVLETLPPPPWPKNVHKDVAGKLGIANRMAHRCISELVRRGHWEEAYPSRTGNKNVLTGEMR